MAKWGLTDNSCQLCFAQPGTVLHRFECKASKPPNGFAPPLKSANLALQRVGPERDDELKLWGVFALQIPSLPFRTDGSLKWL